MESPLSGRMEKQLPVPKFSKKKEKNKLCKRNLYIWTRRNPPSCNDVAITKKLCHFKILVLLHYLTSPFFFFLSSESSEIVFPQAVVEVPAAVSGVHNDDDCFSCPGNR